MKYVCVYPCENELCNGVVYQCFCVHVPVMSGVYLFYGSLCTIGLSYHTEISSLTALAVGNSFHHKAVDPHSWNEYAESSVTQCAQRTKWSELARFENRRLN